MQIDHLYQRLFDAGAKPGHAECILRSWLMARPLAMTARKSGRFPDSVVQALPEIAGEWARLARVSSDHPAADGSARLLVELTDGQMVESVLLPRDGVCVSTQVGCAVGCAFCMTGKSGLLRQLGSAEIVAQVVLARAQRPVKKVVFMGMGEPAHNLDNVLDAIELLGNEGGIGHKNLVFSTVGDSRVFERLPQRRVKPALALSLHTLDRDLREQLLPKAPRIDPQELIAQGEAYARSVGYPIQYQWTLLEGINDSDEEADRLGEALAGKYAMMNYIPFNPVEGSAFRRPAPERLLSLIQRLRRRGIVACLRDSAGQDVDGGCGQLRARAVSVVRTTRS